VGYLGVKPERDKVERFRDAGLDRVVFYVPPEGRDEVRRLLDEYADLI
jgi:hypothetical protein